LIGAYAHLNLKFNPFGELEPEQRALVAYGVHSDIPAMAARLSAALGGDSEAPGASSRRLAVQFMGRGGRGKTTHLFALQTALSAGGTPVHFCRVALDGSLPTLPSGTYVLLVDELQLASFWTRRKIFKRFDALALSTHRDLSAHMRRHGFALEARHIGRTEASVLGAIFARRLELARCGPGAVPSVSPAAVIALRAHFGDNIRGMEGALYDAFLNLTKPEAVLETNLALVAEGATDGQM